jgi:hypothetical protein
MDAITPFDQRRLGAAHAPTKPLVALLALGLSFGLGYLLWLSFQPTVLQTTYFRDGARLSLAAVTAGPMHRYDPALPFFRATRSLKLFRDVPEVALVSSARDEARVWLRYCMDPRGGNRAAAEVFQLFKDEHGCPFDQGEMYPDGRLKSGLEMWSGWRPSTPILPGRRFEICGYYRDTRTEAFRFPIDPPVAPVELKLRQVLTPRPLPQTVAAGDLRATLETIVTVPEPNEPHYRAITRGLDGQGNPFTLLSLSAQDRYGHVMKPLNPDQRKKLPGKGFPFMGLCRREPAWKLVATMAKEPSTGAPPDLVWTFDRLPLVSRSNRWLEAKRRIGARTLLVRWFPGTPLEAKTGKRFTLVSLTARLGGGRAASS